MAMEDLDEVESLINRLQIEAANQQIPASTVELIKQAIEHLEVYRDSLSAGYDD